MGVDRVQDIVGGELDAVAPGAPIVHDEPDTEEIFDRERNIVHHIEAQRGDADAGFAEQVDLFEQYRRVLERIGRDTPVILVIDDLHWADSGTLSLMRWW